MHKVFKTEAEDRLFFFSSHEFAALMTRYSQSLPTGVVKDYQIDGNGVDFVCFSFLKDARSTEPPILSFEKTKDGRGAINYTLYSRASGVLKENSGQFIALFRQFDDALKALKTQSDQKIFRPVFGGQG